MFNICPVCGDYSVEKAIEGEGPAAAAICPSCHHAQPFLRLPLLIITGASGTGKSAVCRELVGLLRGQCVVLESDALWGTVPATPEDDYRDYRNVWLRLAKNIGQCRLPVVLCGTAVPDQFEACPERRYFSALHYLALVCDDDDLQKRLTSRPTWRQSHTAAFVAQMVSFNRWLQEHAALTVPHSRSTTRATARQTNRPELRRSGYRNGYRRRHHRPLAAELVTASSTRAGCSCRRRSCSP